MPPSRCSSSSNSRSERSSRSRSASLFLLCHQFMSLLLGGGPHHARYSFGHLLPLRFLGQELLPAFTSKPVVFEFPISVPAQYPIGTRPILFAPGDAARGSATRAASARIHS